MAQLTFAYVNKCAAADPHVHLRATLDGAPNHDIVLNLSDLYGPLPEEITRRQAAVVLLRAFCRKWRLNNPAGTLPQLRAALEAETWEI